MFHVTWRNWSGSVECNPTVRRPRNVDDVVEVVEDADELRVAGSGHSFSPLVATDDTLVQPDRMNSIDVDRGDESITVGAGVTLGEMTEASGDEGLAPVNLGDVDRQTVAGAVATGTHGTGEFPVLSNYVTSMEVVTPEGDVEPLEEGDPGFDYHRLSLGALGVVTKLEFDVVEDYGLRMERRRRSLDEALEGFRENVRRHRNYEFFWFPYTETALTKATVEADVSGGRRETGWLENHVWRQLCKLTEHVDAAPLAKLASTAVRGKTKTGRARYVYPEPRDVRFNETEYGVPVDELPECFREIQEIVERHDTLYPVEVRFVEADSLPLSPAYGRDSAFIAVHRYHERSYEDVFRECEDVFRRYDGRPHWGKMHSLSPTELQQLYPGWREFLSYREEFDPDGVFLNPYLQRLFGVRGGGRYSG